MSPLLNEFNRTVGNWATVPPSERPSAVGWNRRVEG